MKPICLTMTAFGSFPEKEVIRFDTLGEAPLFLINGPTGSGKTTILDAICFALYGETTGEEREARQMRCDFSSTDALTSVELIFELAGQRYHIRRVPEQLRPKARGEGTTTQAPEAQLWKVVGSVLDDAVLADSPVPEVIVSSKVKDATVEIEKLTGLTVSQFRQVMVLPQGKFRQLLLAESKDREQIFGKLFQTHIYKQLEEKLKQKANAIAFEVKNKQQLQQGVLEGAGVSDVEELDLALKADQSAFAIVTLKKRDLQKRVQDIESQIQAEQLLEQSFQRLEKTQVALSQLMQRQDEFALQRQQIQLAENAERIKPVAVELQRYYSELDRANIALADTAKQIIANEKQQQKVDTLKSEAVADSIKLEENKKERDYLYSLKDRSEAFVKAQQDENAALKQQQMAKQQREKIEVARKDAERNQKVISAELAGLQKKVEDNENLPLQHAKWQKHLETKQQVDLLVGEVATQQRQLDNLKEEGAKLKVAVDNAATYTQRITLIWHQGQAAVLAKALNQGEPCMVCGSSEHPDPAHLSVDDVPSNEQLELARQEEQQYNQQLISAREQYAQQSAYIKGVKRQIDALEESMGVLKKESLDSLQIEMQRLSEVLNDWEKDKEKLRNAHQRMDELRFSEQELLAELERVRVLEVQSQSHYAAAAAVLQQAALEMPEKYRVEGALASRTEQLVALVKAGEKRQQELQKQWEEVVATRHSLISQQQERQKVQKNTESQCTAAGQRWQEVLSASPFDSEDAYHSHQLDQKPLQDMRQALMEFEKTLAEQQGALKQQQEQLANKKRPVLLETQQQLLSLKQDFEAVDAEWLALDKRVSLFLSTQKTLAKMQRQAKTLEDNFALYGTLSSVANGQTYEKISLQRFVLGVLLDDVLIEASRRLEAMSKGRYLLLRKTEKAKGNKASGLELVVDDAYTGVQRPVATLSGGESFMAALSLALGLSDVVQAYSGGIRLDMLFIDEGFGSLDPESLELAIRTLLDLQQAGRMVGVISHVSDLKEQIPLRLDVISSHSGSRTQLVGVLA